MNFIIPSLYILIRQINDDDDDDDDDGDDDDNNISTKCVKCHCLRKYSRGQKLWSTDLAQTLGTEVGCNERFQKPIWLTSLTFSF